MSLSAKRTGLIFISALFFTFSCKEKEKIGLDPGQLIGVNFIDTFSISTKAYLKNDSIDMSKGNYLFAGAYHDDAFGDIEAEAYVQLLQEKEVTPVAFTVIDSVVMTLAYDYQYGDTLQSQTINVYELADDLSSEETYFINHAPIATDPTLLDTDAPFSLKPSTGIQKIYLNNTFGSDILNIIGGGISNSSFKTYFKGIALKPKNNNEGAIIRFKLADNSSKVTIYYRNLPDTIEYSLNLLMNTSSTRFNRIEVDRASTPALSGLINSGNEVDVSGKVYLQSGLGVKTKMFFPGLDSVRSKYGKVAVNRAELIIETDPAVTPSQLDEISLLHLIKLDANGNPKKVLNTSGAYVDDVVQREYQDVNGTTSPLDVVYSSTSNSYSFNISTYVHAILLGLVENDGLLISPHPFVSSTSLNRVIGGEGVSSVKLKLYLTPVK